jgi:iron(III) transport system permease protein
LLVALYTLSDFGAVSLLRFETFTQAIYLQYQGSFDRTLAAALSLLLVALTGGILLLEAQGQGRARYHRSSSGTPRPARRVALGRWRWPAVLLSGTAVLVGLALPIAVLLFWMARGLASGVPVGVIWWTTGNSMVASLLAASGAMVASVPLALLAVRFAGPLTALIERVTYAGYALPGIVIALALVFFGANYAPMLYQTLAMLVLAYIVRFLPQAVGATRATLLQVSPRVEEAARGLGQGPRQVALRVTIPLIRPGLLTGGALVFLTAMKELPATLLLSPIGFDTLATSIWHATSNAMYSQAAIPSLLLVVVSAVPVALMARREEQERP